MKKIKLLAVLMAVVMTVAVVTVCAQPVTASVTDEEAIGFTYSGEDDYEDSTNHCVDWANYTIRQESNYCKDDEAFTGNLYGNETFNFTAPEDLEIVSFKFTLYHGEEGVTLDSYSTFTQMECETADNDIWMLKGSFADASPVTVKKGEPLLTADIEIDVGNCSYGELTGVNTAVYFSVDELIVKTTDGYKVIIGDEDTTEPTTFYDSTGHCEDWANYNIRQDSNYCKDNEVFTGNTYGSHTLNFTAPEDLDIVSFKFTLYHEEEGVTLNSYTPFTAMDCKTAEDDIWMLKGSFAGASPVTVKKGEPLLTADIEIDVEYCSYGELTGVNTTVYFSVDELTVKTANGYEVIIKDMDATEPEEVTTVPADVTTFPAETTYPVVATTSPADTTEPVEPVIKGDVNNDGSVDILDAILIQKYAGEKIQLTDEQIHIADVNNDGNADTLDAILIQEYAAGIITEFPNRS